MSPPDKPNRRASDRRRGLLDAIADACMRLPGRGVQDIDPADFARRYYSNVAEEDLEERTPEELAGAALSHLEFARQRRAGQPRVRVFNPAQSRDGWSSQRTIVQIVNDNMPFLVDSTTMAMNRLGHGIHLTIHPLVAVRRDRRGRLEAIVDRDGQGANTESLIQFELLRVPDPDSHRAIEQALLGTLADVRAAVDDWQQMLARLRVASAELRALSGRFRTEDLTESCDLLDWMAEDHFTLLGYREYALRRQDGREVLVADADTGLGLLRAREGETPSRLTLTEQMRKVAHSTDPLVITKANTRSTVHRPGYLDYIGVKIFDEHGKPVRERRFLGLFTSAAYSRSPRNIPLLRQKVSQVFTRSALEPGSHRGKALMHILETFPRDELFQIGADDLKRIATGILNLQERRRVRLFLRRDPFRRFFSCLIYVPRDRFNTSVRERIEATLREDLGGYEAESMVRMSESVLVRLHTIVRTETNTRRRRDATDIERRIEDAVTTWHDRLWEVLSTRFEESRALALHKSYAASFPAAYVEDVTPREASFDLERVDAVASGRCALETSLYRPPGVEDTRLRFKICRLHQPLPLSYVLPVLENLGLEVLSERPYRLVLQDYRELFLQDLDLSPRGREALDPQAIGERFQRCFREVLDARIENDSLNQLVLVANFDWREAAFLRACTKYLVQTGMPFSQAYMQQTLVRHPALAQAVFDYFRAQFDPDIGERRRPAGRNSADERIDAELAQVSSLDEDRILRGYADLVRAMLRCNYFQHGPDGEPPEHLSFKLDPSRLPELPRPRPKYEIFVYSPRVEGVHLRAGRIARGGLRWSDRREDFRTEVLGLMKAQQVKNTVIVPNGAKGGFVCKQLPAGGDRDAVQAEVERCYRTFICGLLDLTDNIVDDRIVPPPRVRRVDGDDPYLVVAADKGTATFSDRANSIAAEYDFWLQDAFASGGSNGYDHKKMGITARGAWEAVKRHFREIGVDTQNQPFTVAGIGDMGGDVFGNGMLLSRCIRLVAAFNHQHIFLDPDPDPEAGFTERERLFRLPRSSWADYDTALLSPGGGVYERSAKSIEVSPEAARVLGLRERRLTPHQLIQAILKMPVDLLWNGGIGTYVKAVAESHDDVGDRANDTVRVNGRDLRCRVIGEGGNLGVTQRGRIEYTLNGGRCNTDFIDNSGGVEGSDREVNIKILLRQAMTAGRIKQAARDRLLAEMSEEVAALVLRTNYQQTLAISIAQSRSAERLSEYARVIRSLESSKLLDRALESLPEEEAIIERRDRGQGLTRPEIATLLSYSKLQLFDALCESDVPEDAYFARDLHDYFPEPLRKRYRKFMPSHRLGREIIAMLITSSMINRMGPAFPLRTQEETGCNAATVARAYTIAREVSGMRDVWSATEALDNRIDGRRQLDMLFESARQLRYATHWVLRHHAGSDIDSRVRRMAPGVTRVLGDLPGLVPTAMQRRFERATRELENAGVPAELAASQVALGQLIAAMNIVEAAEQSGTDVADTARAYFELGRALKLDWLEREIDRLQVDGRWQALGRSTLRGSLHDQHRALLQQCLAGRGEHGDPTVQAWLERHRPAVVRVLRTLGEMQGSQRMDFATLSVAVEEVRLLGATK